MIHARRMLVIFVLSPVLGIRAQTFPAPEYVRQRIHRPVVQTQVPGPEGLRDYVAGGKLRLGLEDAVRMALLNNTDIRLDQLPIEDARLGIERAYQPFDAVATSGFTATRSTSPSATQLEGAPTLTTLNQATLFGYSQTFQTGTTTRLQFSGNKLATNSHFATFNPSITSGLNFSISQPLLRNRGIFPNRAPIVIAHRNLDQSRANFETQVNNAIEQAVDQYWNAIQARENLKVQQKSLELAETSYKRDKRALELGALSPLDIYRSESQVASRRVAVIQAEYALKQAEDQLRRTLGADLDLNIRALDLELAEPIEPTGELLTIDAKEALERALAKRPELEAIRQQLAKGDTNIRLAHNNLEPDLSLTAFYTSNGLGGNALDPTTTPPTILSQGGFPQALSQVFGFNFPTYGFTLQLRLPIKNRAAEADLGTARVARQRDLYTLRNQEQAITLEVSNSVHQLEQAKLSMAAAKVARDLSQKNLEAEQHKYELGAGQIFLVLEAQTELAQAELTLVQAEVGYRQAVTAVERITGRLLDRYGVQIAGVMH